MARSITSVIGKIVDGMIDIFWMHAITVKTASATAVVALSLSSIY